MQSAAEQRWRQIEWQKKSHTEATQPHPAPQGATNTGANQGSIPLPKDPGQNPQTTLMEQSNKGLLGIPPSYHWITDQTLKSPTQAAPQHIMAMGDQSRDQIGYEILDPSQSEIKFFLPWHDSLPSLFHGALIGTLVTSGPNGNNRFDHNLKALRALGASNDRQITPVSLDFQSQEPIMKQYQTYSKLRLALLKPNPSLLSSFLIWTWSVLSPTLALALLKVGLLETLPSFNPSPRKLAW